MALMKWQNCFKTYLNCQCLFSSALADGSVPAEEVRAGATEEQTYTYGMHALDDTLPRQLTSPVQTLKYPKHM